MKKYSNIQPAGSLTRRIHLKILGRVQGVGYRWFVQGTAERLGIAGWVRNLEDGSVEAQAQGSMESLAGFIAELKTGHSYARVNSVESREIELEASDGKFVITR